MTISAATAATAAATSTEQFLAWGWRVPFVASLVPFGVGFYVRKRVTESPVLTRVARTVADPKEGLA